MTDTFIPWPQSSEKKEEDERQYYPGSLPSPEPSAMGALRDELYQDAEKLLATDPRYRGLLPGPTDASGGTGDAVSEPPPEELENFTPWPDEPEPEPEPDSLYQRAIYGLERGGARAVQSLSQRRSRGLSEQLAYLEQNPEQQAEYARRMRPEDPDPERFIEAQQKALQDLYTAQEIRRTAISGIPIGESLQRAAEAETFGEFWDTLRSDPVGIAVEGTMESLPNMVAGLIAGLFGGAVPAALSMGTSSFIIESEGDIESSILEIAQKIGADISTTEGQEAVAATPELKQMMEDAQAGGFIVGAFDTVAGLLPGIKLLGKNKPIRESVVQTLAQMVSGGAGEAGKQLYQEGEITKPGAVGLEVFLEGPLGAAEVAATTYGARQLDKDTRPSKPGTGETTPVPPTSPGGVLIEDTSPDNMSQAEKEALGNALDELEASEGSTQGALDIPPPPQAAPATTPTSTPKTAAPPAPAAAVPTTPEAAPAPVEDQVVTTEDLVTQPTPEPEVTEKPAPVESPMIQKKEVQKGFRQLIMKTEGSAPGIRKAVQNLGVAIASVFPNAKKALPSLKGTVGAKRIGEYFAALDEEISIEETLPNLKEFLREIVASPDAATAIQNINRLSDYVANSGAGLVTEGETGPVVGQAAKSLTAYEAFEGRRKAGEKKYTRTVKGKKVQAITNRSPENKPVARAIAIDELATTVRSLIEAGYDVGTEAVDLIARARNYRETSQTVKTYISKGGAGSTQTNYQFNRKNLDEVGGKLAAIIKEVVQNQTLVDAGSKKETSISPEKGKGEAKVEESSAPTEAVSEPKEAAKAKKVSKSEKKKKPAAKKPAKKPAEKRELNDLLAEKPEDLSYPELRRVAKSLGVKAVGKKDDILAAVKQWQVDAAEMVGAPGTKTEASKIAKAQKEVKEGMGMKDMLKTQAEREAEQETDKKPAVKVTVKKTRKIADPEKVIEVVPSGAVLTGQKAKSFGEEMEVELGKGVVDRALEKAGIPKKQAAIVKAIIAKADKTGARRIITAIKEYRSPADMVTLVATVFDVLGGQVQESAMQELIAFANSQAENRAANPRPEDIQMTAQEEALAAEAEAMGVSLEDYKEYLKDTQGFVEEEEQAESPWSDPYQEMSAEEWENSQFITEDGMPKGAAKDRKVLARAVMNAKQGLLNFMYQFTKSRGKPNPGPTNVNDLLDAIIKALPSNHRYAPLARRLRQLNLDVPVYIFDEAPRDGKGAMLLGGYWAGNDYDAAGRKIRLYVDQEMDPRHIFHSALHEIVHAATLAGYEADPKFKADIDALLERARLEMDRENPNWRNEKLSYGRYGLTDGKEFIAEALTNPVFQQWLAGIDSVNTRRSGLTGLMRDFVNRIKKYFGYSIRNSLLEDVIVLVEERGFQTEEEVLISQQKLQVQKKRVKEAKLEISDTPAVDTLKENIQVQGKNKFKQVRNLGKRFNLGISGRDAIERENRSLFDKAAAALNIPNPLTAFDNAKNQAQSYVREFEKKAFNILKAFSDLPNEVRSVSQLMMKDITMANIDPTRPLNSAANAHLWTNPTQTPKPRKKKDGTWYTPKPKKPQIRKKYRARAIKARDDWLSFSKKYPEAAKMLRQMAALTKLIHSTKISFALTALGEAYKFDQPTINALSKAKTAADIDAIFDPKEVETLTAQLEGAKKDLVGLTKEEKKELKTKIATAESRQGAAKSAKTIIHDSSIKGWYFPLRRYGNYIASTGPDVTGDDKFVRFFETQVEAEVFAEKYNAKASEENQLTVTLKLERSSSRTAVSSVLSDLKRRIKDKPTQQRLEGAMAEILSANASYESQLSRENIDGVATKDMARAFEEYVHVSKYTLGDIRMAHAVANAMAGINRIAKNADTLDLTADEVVQAGRVQNELAKRNQAEGMDRKKNNTQKVIGTVGFLNFLGAPSYWALNFTQTYIVTIPYLAAKYGAKEGPAALFRAQAQVLGAVNRAMRSGEKSYEGFKKQLPPAARKVVEALESDNVLQSTIAHEFGDIISPSGFKKLRDSARFSAVGKTATNAMLLMERIPEAIEHYNRISTALATYELSNGDYVATKDAVNQTQMNYDTNNRARLLKTLPGDRAGYTQPYITPIMMFKTFGVGMFKLFYGAAFKVAFEKGGRQEALRLAGYLMATHTLASGVAGGVMVAPVATLIAIVNSTLEPDDEWDLEEAAREMGQELGGDFLATTLEKGLFASVLGIDFSRSISLANLLWMSNDNLDYTKYGDLEQGTFTALGPVAQYAGTSVREGLRLITGDPKGGWSEFMAAIVPVKAARGTIQAIDYSTRGIRAGDLKLIKPDEFSAFMRTAMGFQATQKTDIRNVYYEDQKLEAKRSSRKSRLVKKADKAIQDNDWKKLQDILMDMQSFNLSVPEAKYRVNSGDIARYRSRARTLQREFDRKYNYSN